VVHRTTLLLLLVSLAGAGCASTGPKARAVPRPFPGAPLPPAAPAGTTAAAPDAERATGATPSIAPPLIATALGLRGVAYRNGGSDPSGFDCSGFVQWVFARHGTTLPREVREQFLAGREIDDDQVNAGDLVFFETVSRGASHVGIALGDGAFIHAPSSRGVVRVERYTTGYWSKRWVGARRAE
jgi:cell wall-associated NlpC family hydrolase